MLRRTKAELATIRDAILEIVAVDFPWTLRGVFYQLVGRELVEKTENAYKYTVGHQVLRMRLDGILPWDAIADHTREVDWNRRWANARDSIEGWLDDLPDPEYHTRYVWTNQPCMVIIFLEKDALAEILGAVTQELQVPLAVTRGYPSVTFLHDIGEAIAKDGRPHFIYQIGDHDPAGADIPRNIEERLREFAPNVDLSFRRLAVTAEQIRSMNLPTRPTKRNDPRGKKFKGESVEVDAIPPGKLRGLLRAAILGHRDYGLYEKCLRAEKRDRLELKRFRARVARLLGR